MTIWKKEIEKIEVRKATLQDRLLDGDITPQDYQTMKERVEKDLVLSKSKLYDLTANKIHPIRPI